MSKNANIAKEGPADGCCCTGWSCMQSASICILQRVPDPCQTMPPWSHTSHTYLSMLYHECMGTCGHGSTRQQAISHVAKSPCVAMHTRDTHGPMRKRWSSR